MNIFSKKMYLLLAGITTVLLTEKAIAQDCGCAITNLNGIEQLRDNNDTTAAFPLIQQLKASENKNCIIYGYTLDVLFLITGRQMDSVKGIIEQQEKAANALSCKQSLLDQVYLNYTRFYKRQNDYENMSVYAFKALANAELNKNKENELRAIKDITHVFTRQDQDDKIPEYVKKAEKIILDLPDSYMTAANYNWLAFEYETWYTRIQRKTLLDSAMLFTGKAIASAKTYNNFEQITQSFRVHEAVAYHQGELRKAVAAMDSALFYAKQIKILTTLGGLYIAKAMDHLDLGEKIEAMKWADTSIWYVDRDFKGTPSALGVYKQAAELYESAGDLPKSYATFKAYEKMKDSLFKIQRTEKINELEQKYNKTKNEKTIKELAQQKRIYVLLAVAGLFALVGLIFFIRQQSLKNKQKVLETEQRLNRARMNPHFFFNALSSLQSYALDGNDGKSIASNLSKFSHIMRETLESTYKEYVTIEQEVDFLKEYLELQKIRFPQKFSYEVITSNNIEPQETLIPSMILQPFAENSIEHGFTSIDYAGHIVITFTQKEKELHISIVDNGKGLATIARESTEHISRASQIIKDRIYLLNIKLKTKAAFSIENNSNGKGVAVLVKLPLLYKQDIKA